MDDAVSDSFADLVRQAAAQGRPLRIRGSGSKDFYGQSGPHGHAPGRVLDTRALAGVAAYEPSELFVTARAGTRLRDLEALLAQHGQCLPFEPPQFGAGGTVGGMVAAGLSGPARASAGSVRDHVLGVEIINGRGEQLRFGGQVIKNVAGYDVSRLMCGSLGTLALITEVSLKVLPRPAATCTLAFEWSETTARQQLNRWGGQPLPLSASSWQDGVLRVRLAGAEAGVAAACRLMGGQRVPEREAARYWPALRDQALPFFRLPAGEALWRLSVPDTAPPLNLGETLLEWHGALRWLRLPATAAPQVREAAARAGGHATLFRGGDGATPVFTPLPAPLLALHRALKAAFDPAGVFGPGRMGW
ncbi:MAG: glycolate oxidase subunit GlcE [Comamonadaceae bacterium]|nr:glycolate oxidase subunit GlcE [Comamonadaceae bacterium]